MPEVLEDLAVPQAIDAKDPEALHVAKCSSASKAHELVDRFRIALEVLHQEVLVVPDEELGQLAGLDQTVPPLGAEPCLCPPALQVHPLQQTLHVTARNLHDTTRDL